MEIQFVVALALAIPIVLFPVAFVWYRIVGGTVATVEGRDRRTNAAR